MFLFPRKGLQQILQRLKTIYNTNTFFNTSSVLMRQPIMNISIRME